MTAPVPLGHRLEMFAAYCEDPVYSHVAARFGITPAQVRAIAEADGWKARVERVRASVLRTEDEVLQARAKDRIDKSLSLLGGMKALLSQDVKRLVDAGAGSGTRTLAADISSIVNTEAKLLGVGDRDAGAVNVTLTFEDVVLAMRAPAAPAAAPVPDALAAEAAPRLLADVAASDVAGPDPDPLPPDAAP